MPSSDVRSSETSAQNVRGKNFQKFMCSNFHGFVFRGSYFRVLVVGRENRENLDLAKISRYTVLSSNSFWFYVRKRLDCESLVIPGSIHEQDNSEFQFPAESSAN